MKGVSFSCNRAPVFLKGGRYLSKRGPFFHYEVAIPEHERDNTHRQCYLAWCELERRLSCGKGAENILESSIEAESFKWYNILKRIIDVVLFLGERGLAFRGSTQRISA